MSFNPEQALIDGMNKGNIQPSLTQILAKQRSDEAATRSAVQQTANNFDRHYAIKLEQTRQYYEEKMGIMAMEFTTELSIKEAQISRKNVDIASRDVEIAKNKAEIAGKKVEIAKKDRDLTLKEIEKNTEILNIINQLQPGMEELDASAQQNKLSSYNYELDRNSLLIAIGDTLGEEVAKELFTKAKRLTVAAKRMGDEGREGVREMIDEMPEVALELHKHDAENGLSSEKISEARSA